MTERKIQYLNTDLDLVSDVDLGPLNKEFDHLGLALHLHAGDDDRFYLMCEDTSDVEPERNIIRMLNAIDQLSDEGSRLWKLCSVREFNIGYECGDEPRSFEQGVSNKTLRRIVECGASLKITLYPHVK